MDPIYFTEKLLRQIRERTAQLEETLLHGAVQDWESYRQIVGELSGLRFTEQLIIDLLDSKEKNE
jgi:hypothetical protein|tara:strand:- start:536 stop:730 length:195 start_codon:yes stop_codon:yes gene_type:complete